MSKKNVLRTLFSIVAASCWLFSAAPVGAVTWGIADQKPAIFGTPQFAELQSSGVTTARFILPFDAFRFTSKKDPRHYYASQFELWLKAVEKRGIEPVVTFRSSLSQVSALRRSQTLVQKRYLYFFKRFRKRFRSVKYYSIWNEPNITHPYKYSPRGLGRLYRAVRDDVRAHRPDITLIGGDLYGESTTGSYARDVERGARTKIPIFGINNYVDVNRYRHSDTKSLVKSVSSRIWITETGGVYSRSARAEALRPFAAQFNGARTDSARLRYQSRAITQLGRIVERYKDRIDRVYVYQLQGAPNPKWVKGSRNGSWDSGLIDPHGREREAFSIFKGFLPGPNAEGSGSAATTTQATSATSGAKTGTGTAPKP